MDSASPSARSRFAASLGSALHIATTASRAKTRAAKDKIFALWVAFCDELGVPATIDHLQNTEDRLCYILVFGMRYRETGQTGKPVRADAVEAALLSVGQGITHLGASDPRKPYLGSDRNHPLLSSFLKGLRDEDAPTSRTYPVNTTILIALRDALDTAHPQWGQTNAHVINLCILAFFWLLRPAEYTNSLEDGRSQAFRFMDVHFHIDGKIYAAPSAPLNDETILRIAHTTLEFSDQKNCVRGEKVGHAATKDPFFCPCKAAGRLALHLQRHNAAPETPLHHHVSPSDGNWYDVPPRFVTNALRHAALQVQHVTGIDPALISARSLRPGGATALLCAGIDSDAIQLLGRWRSDAMLRYLRVQAHTFSAQYSHRMWAAGSFTFAPSASHDAPDTNEGHPIPLPQELPESVRVLTVADEPNL